MRKALLLALMDLFLISQAFSQAESDSSMYYEGIDILNRAKTTDNYLEAAFYFGQLSTQYPRQWLVYYYAGLSYIQASQKALVSKYRDELLDKAQPLIDKAFSLHPGEPELQILQAFLFQARLQVDPQVRGMNYSRKADTWLKQAMAANPLNPRAHFLNACNVYYTPVIFKGGPKNALPLFLKARDKFRSFTPELPFMPDWGEAENQKMINNCKTSDN
jgi:tetratricopeptide (TPR) repeat protein